MSSVTSTADRPTGTAPGSIQDFTSLKPKVLFVAYHVADIDRALAFYVGVLGMKEQNRLPLGNGEHEVVLGFPDGAIPGVILMWNTERKTPYRRGDGYSRFVMSVADIDAAIHHLKQHGTEIAIPISDAGRFFYAMFKDPDGYVIELLQMKK